MPLRIDDGAADKTPTIAPTHSKVITFSCSDLLTSLMLLFYLLMLVYLDHHCSSIIDHIDHCLLLTFRVNWIDVVID